MLCQFRVDLLASPGQFVRRQRGDAIDALNQPLQLSTCVDDGALQAGLRGEALRQLSAGRLI